MHTTPLTPQPHLCLCCSVRRPDSGPNYRGPGESWVPGQLPPQHQLYVDGRGGGRTHCGCGICCLQRPRRKHQLWRGPPGGKLSHQALSKSHMTCLSQQCHRHLCQLTKYSWDKLVVINGKHEEFQFVNGHVLVYKKTQIWVWDYCILP